MTWEHDDILTCWIYPMIQRYNDTEILWAIEDGDIYIFEIETSDLRDGENTLDSTTQNFCNEQ